MGIGVSRSSEAFSSTKTIQFHHLGREDCLFS